MEDRGDSLEELQRAAIRQSNRPILILDAGARIAWANPAFERLFGYALEEVRGRRPSDVMASPRMDAESLAAYREQEWGRREVVVDATARAKDGRDVRLRVFSAPLETGRPEYDGYSVAMLTDVSGEVEIRELEREILGALTGGLSFTEVGVLICRQIEAITPGVLVALTRIIDGRLDPWAAPSFPPGYQASHAGVAVGEGVAACGTAAARGEPVMIPH
ncbi:MAG: PAS domain S-box protein, partial [Nocardioides sp.]|uniref:PAS domain S-box protein n=1 Tax=Nocardioides sp. TaxID=35761 RepID=UPI0039E71C75